MSADSQRKRRALSDEFNGDAVDLFLKQNSSFAAATLAVGVGKGSLRR